MRESFVSKIKAILSISRDVALDVRPPLVATASALDDMVASRATHNGRQIDNQTWKDLDLDKLSERVSRGLSITGQIYLHLRLRGGGTADDVARFRSVFERPQDVQGLLTLFDMMRAARVNICEPLFISSFLPAPALGKWTWIPIPLLIASMVLVKFSPVGWLGIVCSLLFTGFITIRLYLPMKEWHQQREVLLNAIATARRLRERLPEEVLSRLNLPTVQDLDSMQRAFRATIWGRSESVAEYTNILFLTQYTEMYRQLRAIPAQTRALRCLVQSISDFEADLGVMADARTNELTLSIVESASTPGLAFQGLRNPLLPSGAPVAVEVDRKGLLLTGKNGIGKSTLLRTIAVSVVVYRSFGAAYAQQARISCRYVMSSMRIDDNLALGDSSHVAEAKRIRDMITYAAAEDGCLLVIDEVFSATNHIESVAVSVPALARLASHGLVLVSTHNLILAPLLRDSLRPVKLEVMPGGGRRVSDGVMGETNGIDVLESIGFDADLIGQSRVLAARLEELMKNPDAAKLPDLGELKTAQLIPLRAAR